MYIVSLVVLIYSAVFMPWTELPIVGGFEIINNNMAGIVLSILIFTIALFFVDDKLSALITGIFLVLALGYIVFHFFNFGGFIIERSMTQGGYLYNYFNYGYLVYVITSIISLISCVIVFMRDD